MSENDQLGGALGRGALTGSLIAVVMLAAAVGIDAAREGLTENTRFCLSYIVAGLAGGILQQVWFNWRPTRRLAYSMRLLGFGLTYYAVLVGCAALGRWLPAEHPWAWVTFTVIFLAILVALTLVIGAFLHRRGIEYKERLDAYHARRHS
ncbi:MAG: hypothetical protein ACFN02_04950 [Olsenella profusa]